MGHWQKGYSSPLQHYWINDPEEKVYVRKIPICGKKLRMGMGSHGVECRKCREIADAQPPVGPDKPVN